MSMLPFTTSFRLAPLERATTQGEGRMFGFGAEPAVDTPFPFFSRAFLC